MQYNNIVVRLPDLELFGELREHATRSHNEELFRRMDIAIAEASKYIVKVGASVEEIFDSEGAD